jgi:hypothetical protein
MVRLFLAVTLVLAFFAYAPAGAGASCVICHTAMEGKVKGSKGIVELRVDAERFSDSVHGALECTDCHITYSLVPHSPPGGNVPKSIAGLVSEVSLKSKIDPVAQSACDICHSGIYEQYMKSVHGRNIFEKNEDDAPLCIDCHGSPHYIVPSTDPASPVNHSNVLHTCGNCHEREDIAEKYGFSKYVIEKYKESFHGKKYILGSQKVPICNDCHGSHNITAWDAPDSPVSGEGKIKTCGKCHKGATAKFAAAPAHKYIGKDNPIPYYSEKALVVLLLGVFAFIMAHVGLDIIAEIREKVSGKKGEHHE